MARRSGKEDYVPFSLITFAIPRSKTTSTLELGTLFDGYTHKSVLSRIELSSEIKVNDFLKELSGKNEVSSLNMTIDVPEGELEDYIKDQVSDGMPFIGGEAKEYLITLNQVDGSKPKIRTVIRNWNVEVEVGGEKAKFEYRPKDYSKLKFPSIIKIVRTYELEMISSSN